MSLLSAAATFFMLWWIVLFAVLPWGNRSAHESGTDIEPGTAASAPMMPRLWLKFAITTGITATLFAIAYLLVVVGGFGLDDIPFLPDFSHET